MKNIIAFLFAVVATLTLVSCKKDNDNNTTTAYYLMQDQIGRPAINTVFVDAADKDVFNTTVPSQMGTAFQAKFKTKLLALTGNAYTTNALGLNADQFTGVLATDVLNVSLTGPTTFFDGVPANTLSGRALADDVIDVELLLIFGGPTGTSNPGLTSDGVSGNDRAFLPGFPYLAAAH